MKVHKFKRYNFIILLIVFFASLLYSFTLANKRYVNFEYGKFDLGNMAQIVWNTSQGNFMEVTDQFGTNMPRWGMSHVDPILALLAPIYWVYPHPMAIVLVQQILILSAIFPLFWFVSKKVDSLTAYFVSATYLLYPAVGFTLVWTGFHGISFVAPLLIWLVWFLDKYNFLQNQNRSKHVIYWLLIILMLMGKEEIGAILALGSIFLYFKNKKLAIWTFLISILWFAISFFVIIPAYSDLRDESVQNFVEKTSVNDVNSESVSGGNFFLNRYDYLGDSYSEMIATFFTKPRVVFEVAFEKEKLNSLNNLIGPLGYITAIIPVWLISLPDLAIALLSKDEIFDISNHRIAFMISALFVSYIYFLLLLKHKLQNKFKFGPLLFSILILGTTIYFSEKTRNPIYISGKSLIENKILYKVSAQEYTNIQTDAKSNQNELGYLRNAQVPRNSIECLNSMADIIDSVDPEIYTGPDYLGAHASLRKVNALFPARFWDADLVIADVFETKTIGPLESSGWIFNKKGLRIMNEMSIYRHYYSCGKISAFVTGNSIDEAFIGSDDLADQYTTYSLIMGNTEFKVTPINIPEEINREDPGQIKLAVSREKGSFHDKMAFWTFENAEDEDVHFSFVDYLAIASSQGINNTSLHQYSVEMYTPILPNELPSGNYYIYYGAGDLLSAVEVYVGDIKVK